MKLLALSAALLLCPAQARQSDKVTLGFYYESLCPDCSGAITTGFMHDFMMSGKYDDLFDIMDLVMVPWGNAKENPDKTFTCQHGVTECQFAYQGGNSTAAIASGVSSRKTWPFVYCMEKAGGAISALQTCVTKVEGLTYDALQSCFSQQYYEVQHAGAVATNALCQEKCGCHTWVPWTTVNGDNSMWRSTYGPSSADEVAKAVCKAYKGSSAPSVCSKY